MTTHVMLTAALVVALFSNAILLLMLVLQSSNVDIFKYQRQTTLEQDVSRNSENQPSDYIHGHVNPDFANVQNTFSEIQDGHFTYASSDVTKTEERHFRLGLFKSTLKSNIQRENEKDVYEDIWDNSDFVNRVEKQFSPYMNFQQQNDVFAHWKDSKLRSHLKNWLMLATMLKNVHTKNDTRTSTRPTELDSSQNASDIVHDIDRSYLSSTDSSNGEPSSANSQTPRHLSLKRNRREADAPTNKSSTTGKSSIHGVHEVFSTFTDSELAKFDPAVYDLLVPALVHFETMAIRELESLHSIVISMDFRLENLENSVLNIVRGNVLEPQADPIDNKSELDNPSHILDKKEGFLPATNDSQIFEVHLDLDGSGDVDGDSTPATRPPQPTTMHNVAYYDMYRILSTLEQKVMALENYNVMSDSELTRVRSEVVKMDDKVTELDRRQRNLQIRTSMHTQKITELEVYMSKSELGIHTALDSYGRVNSRLESFKDKLTEFKNDLLAVTGQFGRQDQLTNELRAADSYKAHDIQEMRKSVFNIEGRLNGLYRVLDLNLDTVRSDLRAMLDRLCINNKLAC